MFEEITVKILLSLLKTLFTRSKKLIKLQKRYKENHTWLHHGQTIEDQR